MKTKSPSVPTDTASASKLVTPAFGIRPLGGHILVQYPKETEQIRGGLIIPDSAQEKPQQATVLAVGPGAKTKAGALIAFEVSVGDTVLLGKFSGAEVSVDGHKLTFVHETDVLGIVG